MRLPEREGKAVPRETAQAVLLTGAPQELPQSGGPAWGSSLSWDRGRETSFLQWHRGSDTVIDLHPSTLTVTRIIFIRSMEATGPLNEADCGGRH